MNENKVLFSAAASEQAKAASRVRTSQYLYRRSDLRGKLLFTCADNEGDSCDLAFSAEKNGDGYTLGIHIADVCEYVCENSPLEKEARSRSGLSKELYPPIIKDDVCDLKVGKDRLAVSVFFDMTKDGEVRRMNIEESVVRIAACCIYHEMDEYILAGEASSVMALRAKYGHILTSFGHLYDVAAAILAKRIERGGAVLTTEEYRCTFDDEGKMVSSVKKIEPDCKTMVRELNVFTCMNVGEYMYSHKFPMLCCGHKINEDNYHQGFDTVDAPILATESEHFRVEYLSEPLPANTYSVEPIENDLSKTDKVLKFTRPLHKYSDLISMRMLKNALSARLDTKNINLQKQSKEAKMLAEDVTKADYESYCCAEAAIAEAKSVMLR